MPAGRSRKSWHQNFQRAPREERTDARGEVFDSKSELGRYQDLHLRMLAGEIRNLRRQVSYDLILPDGTPVLTTKGRTAKYTPDFLYEERQTQRCDNGVFDRGWVEIIEDHKGHMDRLAEFRIRVFEAIYKVKVRIST